MMLAMDTGEGNPHPPKNWVPEVQKFGNVA